MREEGIDIELAPKALAPAHLTTAHPRSVRRVETGGLNSFPIASPAWDRRSAAGSRRTLEVRIVLAKP